MEKAGKYDLKPTSHGTGGRTEDEKVHLSSIVDRLNERFGTEFTETDLLSREQVKEDMMRSEDIKQKAKNNTRENFKFAFEKSFMDFVIERMGSNEKFFMKILENEEFKQFIMNDMMNEIYTEMND